MGNLQRFMLYSDKNLHYLLEFSKEGKQDQADLFLRRVLQGNEDLSLLLEDEVEELDSEDKESCGKKKKVIRTAVNIIYVVAPKQSSQKMDTQKIKKRRDDNDLQKWKFPYKKSKYQNLGNPMKHMKIALDELAKKFEKKIDEESPKNGVEETTDANIEEKPKNEEGKLTKKE